jgi:hypothetical protein
MTAKPWYVMTRTEHTVRLEPELMLRAIVPEKFSDEPQARSKEDGMSREDRVQLARLSAKILEIESKPYAEKLRRAALLKALYEEQAEIRRWAH